MSDFIDMSDEEFNKLDFFDQKKVLEQYISEINKPIDLESEK